MSRPFSDQVIEQILDDAHPGRALRQSKAATVPAPTADDPTSADPTSSPAPQPRHSVVIGTLNIYHARPLRPRKPAK